MPALAEPNLETLRPPGNPDDLVELGYRPVFKEHVNRAGQKIGQRELSGITNRCNDRILDTGDFAPLVIRHTKDDGSYDPEVIGVVGPYRMSKFGNKKPVPAIEGKVWVYSHKVDELKKYPRLSVEYWADPDNPGNGYFDPISLLGAETPELDLGMRYSKLDDGRQLMRYSLVERFQAAAVTPAMPGSSNTFVPTLAGDDKDDRAEDRNRDGEAEIVKQQQFSKESGPMQFSPEDLQQFVAAMKPVMEQIIDERMATFIKSQPGEGGEDDLGEDLGGDLDDELGGDDELGLGDDPDLDVGDDLEGLDDDDLGDDDELPEIDDEMPGDETEQPGGDVAAEDDEAPFNPSGEDESESDMANTTEKKPDTKEQYAKENAQLRDRYHKAEARAKAAEDKLTALEKRISAIEGEKQKAVRYSKLTELQNLGYTFDIDEEIKDTEPLNDEQFGRHCDKIVQRYARAPVGVGLYVPASEKRDGVPGNEKRERYAKEATRVALELRGKGQKVEYSEVLANIERNEGKYVAASA